MSTTDTEMLVTPSANLSAQERPFWQRAEQLAQQYAAGLDGPLSAEAQWGMYSFCSWPWCAYENIQSWDGWDLRFDDALLARIDGRMLLHAGVGPLEPGWEPDALVDGMRDFVRWIGAVGHADGEQTERICSEIEFAREAWVLSVSTDLDDPDPWAHLAGVGGCPCCAANAAVAPFVAWLRDTTSFPIERLLMGQALAMVALEQLGLSALISGAFYRLDLGACLEHLYQNIDLAESDRPELAAAACAFATFLAHRCGLSGSHERRMQAEAQRWAATPLRASA